MHYGIDVSSFQGEVNWAAVKADGVEFAHAKSTEGATWRDPTFAKNRDGAHAHGIHFGAYHFAKPGHNPAKQEAFFFRSVAGRPAPGDLRMVLDLEEGTGDLTVWAGVFLSELEKFTGVRPILYTFPSFLHSHINVRALGGYDRWIAAFGRNDGADHGTTEPNVEHQFTSQAVLRGIIGRVDRNVAPSLAPLLVPALKPAPKPVPVPPKPKRRLWPVPVPAWFWAWAQWRLDGKSYQRPWDAPSVIPPWAWIRLQHLGGRT